MDGEGALKGRPTIADLTGDNHLAQVARANWLTKSTPKVLPDVLENELWSHLEHHSFAHFSLLLLEQLQAAERYLWPGFTQDASNHHVILLALLVNVKRQERLPVWSLFAARPEDFSLFFRRVLSLAIDQSVGLPSRTHLLTFVVGAFQSLDHALIRKECAALVSIGIWQNLHSASALEDRLARNVPLQRAWKAAEKRFENADEERKGRLKFDRSWLYTLLLQFLNILYEVDSSAERRHESCIFSERMLELLCDLQSQLPTRRYVNTLLQDLTLLPVIRLSPLYEDAGDAGKLVRSMYELLRHYTHFPVDEHAARQLSRQEHRETYDARIARLQKVALRLHPEKLKILILANYGSLAQRDELLGHLDVLTEEETVELCQQLGLRTSYPEKSLVVQDLTFWKDVLASYVELQPIYTDVIQHEQRILPTEHDLFSGSLVQTDDYNSARPLPIPKLNLQYLTPGDFLWRSFTLYRNEAFYEILKNLEDTVERIQPRRQADSTRFDGFSRMAIPISRPAIIETLPTKVGGNIPSEVRAEIILDVSRLQPGLRREWESLRSDDVVFLLAVHPADRSMKLTNGHKHDLEAERNFRTLRCAEVVSVQDDNGRPLRREQDNHDHDDDFGRPRQRRLILRLDTAAYKQDKDRADAGKGDVYDSINVIVRRKARENNFKAALESIQQLAATESPLPTWLQEVFLGYGDPASANYKRLPSRLKRIDYRDTFLDWQHLIESLPGKTVEPRPDADASFSPPYVLATKEAQAASSAHRTSKKRRRDQPDGPEPDQAVETVEVSTYNPSNTGPYQTDVEKLNSIRFTIAQIEAITSGTQPGLTVIVGPPGTGKTDVTTQIISNIYHNFPQQRTLLIAHSNQALNQLFQKIMALDIDERHLLRLGHGEEELRSEASFSMAGRVDSFLERGAQYLAEVQRLASSIHAPGAHGSSCETAQYFEQVYIQPAWRRYWDEVESGDPNVVISKFPFHDFFENAPQPLFPPAASKEDAMEVAQGCERHIQRIFDVLADIRPFEILRSQRDKSNYLLVKEARIVAMTSTHAAMRRQEIVNLGFQYENVIMEEAAQVTEVENFIPFVLQAPISLNSKPAKSRLQRIVLVGDHLQNSPVVQNAALRTYANLEQSLFQRLIRLGVPYILLDAQGRSRPSLAALYKWRYPSLTNLPFTSTASAFRQANAGLRYEYQFIDVPDYNGRGENEPTPHFLQNLGEAEYAVALYQYMRLLGCPAEKISILCTYAGQRALIRDILTARCQGKFERFFGMPGWVGTVDKYQGEQNDYIILSMVRSRAPGYLRDVRRLTVALSRARLGLYILGRREVFESSLELREAFALLFERTNKLALVSGEMFPAARGVDDDVAAVEMEGVEHLGKYVAQMTEAKIQALKQGRGAPTPPLQTEARLDREDIPNDEHVTGEAEVD